MTNQKPTFSLSEDWTVVVFGFLIIGLYLLGFKIQPPSFGWSDTSDLFGKVLTIKNLTNIFDNQSNIYFDFLPTGVRGPNN